MLTKRAFLLTATGLFANYAAAAQSTAPAAGVQPTDVLSWVVWWAAGVVLLMAIITGGSAASAAQRHYVEATAEPATAPKAASVPAAPSPAASRPVVAAVRAEQAVAA
jgi:hypothetical protein